MGEQKSGLWKFALGFLALMLVGLAVLAGAVVWRMKSQPTTAVSNSSQPKPDEIVITKLPNGEQLVENKTQGSSLEIPGGWVIDGTKKQFYDQSQSCKISANIIQEHDLSINDLMLQYKKSIKDIGFTVISERYENILVDGKNALKFILDTAENGHSVSVGIPTSDKLYGYSMYSHTEDKVTCDNYLDKFLQTISIR